MTLRDLKQSALRWMNMPDNDCDDYSFGQLLLNMRCVSHYWYHRYIERYSDEIKKYYTGK